MRSGAELACHATPCAHAVASAHRPMGTIRPDFSASGMNRPGGTTPSSGCCHRASASTPTMRSALQIDLGLVLEKQLVALERASQLILQRNLLAFERGHQRRVGLQIVFPLSLA